MSLSNNNNIEYAFEAFPQDLSLFNVSNWSFSEGERGEEHFAE